MKSPQKSQKTSQYSNYVSWDNPLVIKGFKVAKQLQTWIFNYYKVDDAPIVVIAIAKPGFAITIAEICVWCSEEDFEEELTLECCVDRYREVVQVFMVPFRKEER